MPLAGAAQVTGIYRDRATIAGSSFMVLFVALVIWLLLLGSTSTGGGSGSGQGGGSGTGAGGGAGDGSGVEVAAGSGAHDGDGVGMGDASSTTANERDESAANPELDDAPEAAQRPPIRVGFTASREQPKPPVPPTRTAAKTRPSAPAGGAAGGAAGGGGGDDTPTFMGVKGRGKRVVYVIDRSGSMAFGERLPHARYELKRSIRALPDDGEFFVIFFDTSAFPMPADRLMRATKSNTDRYAKWIDQQSPGGGTDPGDAMVKALELGPDTIFLMSDGGFDPMTAARIRAANSRNVSVCTVAFHDSGGEELLKRIASENEGSYRFVPAPSGPSAP